MFVFGLLLKTGKALGKILVFISFIKSQHNQSLDQIDGIFDSERALGNLIDDLKNFSCSEVSEPRKSVVSKAPTITGSE